MKKIFYIFILILSVVVEAKSETILPEKIIDSLKSNDFSIVDKTLKNLGIEKGVSGGFSRFQVLQPWVERSNHLFIFGLSWNPYDGYIILMDSTGNLLGRNRIGYIKSISLRQLQDPGDDVIVVDSIAGTGTGFREDHFSIVTINNKGFSKIWEGLSYKHEYSMAAAPEDNIKISASIRFEDLNDDSTYELIQTISEIKYLYNSENKKLSPTKVDKETKVYKLENGKYVFMKILAE